MRHYRGLYIKQSSKFWNGSGELQDDGRCPWAYRIFRSQICAVLYTILDGLFCRSNNASKRHQARNYACRCFGSIQGSLSNTPAWSLSLCHVAGRWSRVSGLRSRKRLPDSGSAVPWQFLGGGRQRVRVWARCDLMGHHERRSSRPKMLKVMAKPRKSWCPWPGSNQHSLRNSILSRARLPIPPQGQGPAEYHDGLSAVNQADVKA